MILIFCVVYDGFYNNARTQKHETKNLKINITLIVSDNFQFQDHFDFSQMFLFKQPAKPGFI